MAVSKKLRPVSSACLMMALVSSGPNVHLCRASSVTVPNPMQPKQKRLTSMPVRPMVVFCIVAGLMALDFVPRKATGAALGIVGISSYAAAGLQSMVSGFLIGGYSAGDVYNFTPVSVFWIIACFLAFTLPVIGWKYLRK